MISNEITTSCNFAFSFSIAMAVISVAWAAYRPALSAGLFMAAISPIMFSAMGSQNATPNNGYPYQYNKL